MKAYFYLMGASLAEICGTLLIPTSQNFTKLVPTFLMINAYVLSLYLLTFTLKQLPLGMVYATWAGLGVFAVAIFGQIVYAQGINWQSYLGLAFIVAGITMVNIYK